jgi:signal transduction histidine kinase
VPPGAHVLGVRTEAPAEILVVDDDDLGRAATLELMMAVGYRVREARDGAQCLAEVASHPPSLILLDVSMPGLDGIETLRRLRNSPHASVPVILLTGKRFDPESISTGLELGAEEYLPKPVRPGELIARVRALLHLQLVRRELEAVKRDQTAMLVHDLKQPLAIIALRAEFVAEESTDEELIRSGHAIRAACRQMEELVNSVLELSSLEAGQMRLQCAPHPVDALLADVVEQFRGIAERRGIALALATAPPAPAIRLEIDRAKIIQVLQNLIGNAIKFTPAGGRIDVRASLEESDLLIAVEDTGTGLSPHEAEMVFDKWAQTKAGRAKGGSGLGLAIARAIVLAHGGRIAAGPRLDQGRGARFWFLLPTETATVRAAAVAS